MNHWLLDTIEESRSEALQQAERVLIYRELLNEASSVNQALIQRTAEALEIATLDLILERFEENEEKRNALRSCAADAFRLYRVLPSAEAGIKLGIQLLRMCALAVLGDMGSDAARLLRENEWPSLPLQSNEWHDRTWAVIIDVWLRLIRKKGWSDRDKILEQIAELRSSQNEFEESYLACDGVDAKARALELIGLYYLAKAAEIFAHFITDGVVDKNYQIQQLLDSHFDRVLSVCDATQMSELEPLCRLLAAVTAQRLMTRGPVIVMHQRPDWVWGLADKLAIKSNKKDNPSEKMRLVQDFIRLEFGEGFRLIELLNHGIGVHHGGLSDDVRALMEWLFEEEELNFLVQQTTANFMRGELEWRSGNQRKEHEGKLGVF